MLGELLYLPETSDELATTHGLIQWKQELYRDVGITQWQIDLFTQAAGATATLITDEYGLPALIVDCDKDPIVWASVARALCIRRVIPARELAKTNLHEELKAGYTPIKVSASGNVGAACNSDKYVRLASGARAVRGISRRDYERQFR